MKIRGIYSFVHILKILPLLLFSVSVYSTETVYLLTLPKAGTHCIMKYFQLLDYINKNPPVKILMSHLSEKRLKLPNNYFEDPNVKIILAIRDPRDIFISALFYIEKHQHWLHAKVFFDEAWGSLSFEEKILEMIDYHKIPAHIQWKYKDRYFPQQMRKLVLKAIRLSSSPNTLVIRFEDLSGGHGKEDQLAAMKNINSFVDLELEDSDQQFLMENLFGNAIFETSYFRIGTINQWKSAMSPSLCEKIKNLYGQELIDLNYENDLNWHGDYISK